jgi:hypothetical protein
MLALSLGLLIKPLQTAYFFKAASSIVSVFENVSWRRLRAQWANCKPLGAEDHGTHSIFPAFVRIIWLPAAVTD